MDRKQVLQIGVIALNNELNNLEQQRVLCAAKLADAATSTGNQAADAHLAATAQAAANTLVMLDRQTQTRAQMIDAMEIDLQGIVVQEAADAGGATNETALDTLLKGFLQISPQEAADAKAKAAAAQATAAAVVPPAEAAPPAEAEAPA